MEYHLQNRGFNKELLELLAPMYGGNVVFFWLWNTMGQLAGYQQYRPNAPKEKRNEPRTGRYYTYRTPEHAYVIGGLETLHFSHEVFLVEGIFDKISVDRFLDLREDVEMKCLCTFGKKISDVQIKKIFS